MSERDTYPLSEGEEDALDVYIALDVTLRNGHFDEARATLAGLVGEPLVVMLAGLSITTPCAARMGAEREALYRAAKQVAGDRASEVLRGLGKPNAPAYDISCLEDTTTEAALAVAKG